MLCPVVIPVLCIYQVPEELIIVYENSSPVPARVMWMIDIITDRGGSRICQGGMASAWNASL